MREINLTINFRSNSNEISFMILERVWHIMLTSPLHFLEHNYMSPSYVSNPKNVHGVGKSQLLKQGIGSLLCTTTSCECEYVLRVRSDSLCIFFGGG